MLGKTHIEDLLTQEIEASAEAFFLVNLTIGSTNNILVELEHEDRKVSIEDCIRFSRAIEGNLDRDEEDFQLIVSSAGMSNPFRVHKQYVKHVGREVKVMMKGGRTETGELIEVDEDKLVVKTEKKIKVEGVKKKQLVVENVTLSFEEINQTKLVIESFLNPKGGKKASKKSKR